MMRIKYFPAIFLWLFIALISGCGGSISPTIINHMVVSETLVTQVADVPSYGRWIMYSPDARRVAYVADRDGGKYFVLDGIPDEKGYDFVGGIIALSENTFSPDSKRTAYIAITNGENPQTDKRWSVVIDGEGGKAHKGDAGSFLFSPDSKHVAYIAEGSVFLDLMKVKRPDGLLKGSLSFSPDSQHLVYVIEQPKEGQSVVLDGVPGKLYDRIGAIAFSPDSQQLVYVIQESGKQSVVFDGVPGELYDRIGAIAFSPDSQHLAYVAESPDHGQFVVLDGKELSRHKKISGRPVFSPDSNHMVYNADNYIFIDGVKKGSQQSGVIDPVFSPDSKRLAYIDYKSGLGAQQTAAWAVVDGTKGTTYDNVRDITFSPDNKHVAYIASQGKKTFIVVDGARSKEKENDSISKIVWDSNDSFHYLIQRGNSIYLVEESIAGE